MSGIGNRYGVPDKFLFLIDHRCEFIANDEEQPTDEEMKDIAKEEWPPSLVPRDLLHSWHVETEPPIFFDSDFQRRVQILMEIQGLPKDLATMIADIARSEELRDAKYMYACHMAEYHLFYCRRCDMERDWELNGPVACNHCSECDGCGATLYASEDFECQACDSEDDWTSYIYL